MLTTYHTKLLDNEFFQDMATLFCQIQRKFYVAIYKKKEDYLEIFKDFLKKYNIHGSLLNSINFSIKQLVNNTKANLKYTNNLKKIAIQKSKQSLKTEKNKYKRHYLKHKIHHLTCKIKFAKANINFGSKKLWKKQFKETTNHEEWKKEWHQHLHNQFLFVGDKNLTQSNQLCKLYGTTLQIIVPYCLQEKYGKYVIIENITFNHGQNEINNALNKKPITYRFVNNKKGWYLHATVDTNEPEIITNPDNGCMGIDINPRLLGIAICDNEGNLRYENQISFNVGTSNQTRNTLSEKINQIVDLAVERKVPICIEDLDFSRKKVQAQGKYARMLNGFVYAQITQLLERRCIKLGVKLHKRNPAHSSTIGLIKFMPMYGLNSATAAALVLARRLLRKSERIPSNVSTLLPKDDKVHVWSKWSSISKKSKSLKRHSFFVTGANSPLMVTLSVGSEKKVSKGKVGRKQLE